LNILVTVSVRWWNANAYYAISIARALADLGHRVVVAGDPDYPPTLKAKEWNLETIEIRFSSFNPVIILTELFRLNRFIKNNQIDILFANRSEDHLFAGLIKKHCKIPLIRGLGDVRAPKNNRINRWLHFKQTDFHILSSYSIWIRYKSTWPDFNPDWTLIKGGIDRTKYYREPDTYGIRKKLGIPEHVQLVGIIGRLSPVKDHFTFIMAASLILEEFENTMFIISGNEEEISRQDLKNFAESLNLNSHLKIIDRHHPVRELLSILDAVVIPSKGSEVIARVAMECMATGTPVVATDINVLPEVIQDKHNGLIVPAEDPHELARAVIQLLNQPELRKRISENNLRDCRTEYDILVIGKKIEKIFKALIGQK
jgi:glycosyltransferase involved in cell wall biosynthesis